MPKPFLKWVGGKGKIAHRIANLFCQEMQRYATSGASWPTPFYWEPFMGGGAVFFEIASRYGGLDVLLSDGNPWLVKTYEGVRDDLPGVFNCLERHAWEYNRDPEGWYYKVRSELDFSDNAGSVAADFILLNKTGYNGLFRANRKGKLNTPWGKRRSFEPDRPTLTAARDALQGVRLQNTRWQDAWRSTVAQAGVKRTFIYADPPYLETFDAYIAELFTEDGHRDLAKGLKAVAERGGFFVLSHTEHPFIRDTYPESDYVLEPVIVYHSVSQKPSSRGGKDELLVYPRR